MVAKLALPRFGGSPAVWNTSLVFFQAMLLIGYLYAYLSIRWLGVRRQSLVHCVLLCLPLIALPIRLRIESLSSSSWSPTLSLMVMLAVTAGIPFLIVSTTNPVLQRWFSELNHPAAADPYFLYVASNAGSLIALIAYPVLVEPYFTLVQQGWLWSAIYVGFAATCVVAALLMRTFPAALDTRSAGPAGGVDAIAWRRRLQWVFLAFVPSSLMVGVTTYLSTDVASAPFLWVVPLAIYLLTFIIAFARKQLISMRVASSMLAVAVVATVVMGAGWLAIPIVAVMGGHLLLLFAAGLLAHAKLANDRPDSAHLTEFYLLISVGGVLGGVFNALLAPTLFNVMIEYSLVIVLAVLLRPGPRRIADGGGVAWTLDFVSPLLLLVIVAACAAFVDTGALVLSVCALTTLLFMKRPVRFGLLVGLLLLLVQVSDYAALHRERTFFGVSRVIETSDHRHVLAHGTTIHGIQDFSSAARQAEPLSYYSRSGPIGQTFELMQTNSNFDQVAVVGLGAGSLAAYGQPGQTFAFFEIDPSVVNIASDSRYFTFLSDTPAELHIVVGDGRLRLNEEDDGRYDLVVLDAFSSDSVPVHLLTVEAVELYFQKLAAHGVVAMHISNRNLELEPVVAAAARSLRLHGVVQVHSNLTDEQRQLGVTPSHWVVLARNSEDLAMFSNSNRWQALDASDESEPWTDDFSNVLSTLKWLK
jgi:hypothetical protein